MNLNTFLRLAVGLAVMVLPLLVGCAPTSPSPDGELQVVASTTFVGDTVRQIVGDEVDLSVLLEPGQNPHAYQSTPQDLARVAEADLFFVNGFQLENFLDDLVEGSGNAGAVVVVSEGIEPVRIDDLDQDHGESADHEEDADHDPGEDDDHDHAVNGLGQDPHVWFDPNNVIIWVENIAEALAEEDPERAAWYRENAQGYQEELRDLDSWIRTQVDQIPPGSRKLVTDHTSFGYFAQEYGFKQVGAVISASTTEAETSGQQLAELIDTIRDQGVEVIFVSADTDPALSERVAEDTGAEVIPLYFGSLTAGEPADTYLKFMRYNVKTIVQALK